MNKRTLHRLISLLAALVMGVSLLTGCSGKDAEQTQEQEDAQTILATSKQMEALLADKSGIPTDGDAWVKDTWRDYVSGGGAVLAEPENYMTLR